MLYPPYSPNLASSNFYLFPTVKEKLERIQLADEDQFFECLQGVLRGLDQQELNRIFQAWVRRVQEVSETKAMEATSDDKQVFCIKVLRIFIIPGFGMYLSIRRYAIQFLLIQIPQNLLKPLKKLVLVSQLNPFEFFFDRRKQVEVTRGQIR
jgi:hypothetical protein